MIASSLSLIHISSHTFDYVSQQYNLDFVFSVWMISEHLQCNNHFKGNAVKIRLHLCTRTSFSVWPQKPISSWYSLDRSSEYHEDIGFWGQTEKEVRVHKCNRIFTAFPLKWLLHCKCSEIIQTEKTKSRLYCWET